MRNYTSSKFSTAIRLVGGLVFGAGKQIKILSIIDENLDNRNEINILIEEEKLGNEVLNYFENEY